MSYVEFGSKRFPKAVSISGKGILDVKRSILI